MKHYDYIIVGQGLAGTILALSLQKKEHSFLVIDNNHQSSSSFIAAGVTHPMSFKRTILSWKGNFLFPYAKRYYRDIEKNYGKEFYEPNPLFRLISSIEEQNNWAANSADYPMKEILEEPDDKELNKLSKFPIKASYGYGKISMAGRLNLTEFLSFFKKEFEKEESYFQDEFDFNQLTVKENNVEYKGFSAKKIIFCEGFKYIQNPYFSYLPNNLTKGEILIIKSDNIPQTFLSKGIFIYPLSEDVFVVGATYRWKDNTLSTTEDAKNELIEKLELMGNFDYEIIDQKVGIRPTIPDRRPLVGIHPIEKTIAIFNGMGSKGVLFAPYLADNFVGYLDGENDLEKEVDIIRFSKKHLQKYTDKIKV